MLGSGCIGLVTLLALRARGVTRIIVTDVMEKRLEKARELGAWQTVNSAQEDAVQAVLSLTGGMGADVIVETAGTQATSRQAVELAKKGAVIVFVGYTKTGEVTLPMSLALDKELTFKTIFRYRHIYPMAIEAVASGAINLSGIVTNFFEFDDMQNAMDRSVSDKANIVKSVIRIGGKAEG